MKINELKVNSYGKLKDKDIALEDGINVIYGENEKGKSTLLNFMVNIFYGTSRNKKGRDVSDYERYKPWDTEEFSGKLVYTLDNGEKYEVFREFSKKSPKIYGDGDQTRDFIYVKDVATANILACKSKYNGVVNIASGEKITINQLFEVIKNNLGSELEAKYLPRRPGDIQHSLASIENMSKIGFKVDSSKFENHLIETIEWFKKAYQGL